MCYYVLYGTGSINTVATASTGEPTKRDKFKSFCMCQWLISCFKRDETTPVDTIPQEHTSPEVSGVSILQRFEIGAFDCKFLGVI